MADILMIGSCTVLVATVLMQGCRSECLGSPHKLQATEEVKTYNYGATIFPKQRSSQKCHWWWIRAESGHIIHLRVRVLRAELPCAGNVSVNDDLYLQLQWFCTDPVQEFVSSGPYMHVTYQSHMPSLLTFAMDYQALKILSATNRPFTRTVGYTVVLIISLVLLLGVLVSITILWCHKCYLESLCFCSTLKSPFSPSCSALLRGRAHREDQEMDFLPSGSDSTLRSHGRHSNSSRAGQGLAPRTPPATPSSMQLTTPPAAPPQVLTVELHTTCSAHRSGVRNTGPTTTSGSTAPEREVHCVGDPPPSYDVAVSCDHTDAEGQDEEGPPSYWKYMTTLTKNVNWDWNWNSK